ncbi:MAG: FMN-binding negative transcriptional regulator [Gammaproteobacteria bacterium]|jgi:transcriptional regulator|uniref:FMN-binding negative transcriptional regulator n=1 Tax=Pseudomonas sp. FSL W5-0299 TaxID=1917484 RepID=UPI00098AB9FF|nr:FMN-binding negative transcriptional regulator [Pseudomonas sp. FSL W5-0299]MBA4359164.1 FMN-binding negative transcriptional regulator [Pseudomonas sp.]MBU0524164.1 FMN-binding negative transcriptional regulator [Gammaproteobacteria bacterium]MBU0820426.1 FMN-binding negative transcriptional regulator [Gammaproteobacteria bacterium]MBU0842894.1 FMN-binding negative transcriptional regulator [Gammaproteobacteria bacterium]MBU1841132.1 FMN-binding negative transcriptional regulator [Gammapro
MYNPSGFAIKDLHELQQQIIDTRLALVVTHGEQGLQASHLPLLFNPEQGPNGTLYGHFARGNPQWKELQNGAEALVIFTGADAYVSPGFYPSKAEHGKVVPTWNYVAVHAYGTADVFTEADRLLNLVSALTDRHEASRQQPWKVTDAPADYIDGMLKAIVGFALPIQRLEGKRKLSQNRSAADIAGVREGLAASPDVHDQALAHLMR